MFVGKFATVRSRPLELLIEAARPTCRDETLALLLADVDVGELIRFAEYHRVTSMLFQRLGNARLGGVPEVLDQLGALSMLAQARRLHSLRTVKRVHEALDVPFLVVKGPVLANHWYADPARREFNDVDVLVEPANFHCVVEALTDAGFEPLATNWHGFEAHEVAEVPFGFETSVVDLHWNLVALGRDRRQLVLRTRELFERAQHIEVNAVDVLTLDPVDTLLHLCINAGLDGARTLRSLIDVDTVIRRGPIDFALFLDRAQHAGAARLSSAVLLRAREVLATPIPDDLLEGLSPSHAWLAINKLSDRLGVIVHPGRESVAPGLVLSSGRRSLPGTLSAFGWAASHAISTRAGRPGLTEPGGDLDWQRVPDGDLLPHRSSYFDYVAATEVGLRRVRCRDVDELHRRIGSLQPRSTALLGAAFLNGLNRRRARADLFEFSDGRLGAVAVRYRWTLGRCTAFVLVLDPGAAAPLAALLEGSDVTELAGMDSDVRPLRPLLPRWRHATPATAASLPAGFVWPDVASNVRRAERSDLDRLVDVFWLHAPHTFPNRWMLRSRLKRAIDHMVLVLETGDPPVPVGYALRDSSTPEYDYWAQVIITPDHRGQRLSWELAAAMAAIASERGVGVFGCVVESNPMPIPDDALTAEGWNYVTLSDPHRFRGEGRLRRALDVVLQLPARAGVAPGESMKSFRSPGVDDELVTERRTQRWWQTADRRLD